MFSKTTRFEKLLEAVPDALVEMDQKGVIRFVNRQTEALFGYDRDDLVGQPIETLVPEPMWQVAAEHRDDSFADFRTRSSGLDLVLSGRQRDGTEFPVNISLSHIDTGDVLLVITAAGDVTSQRQALENSERMMAIIENSHDAIIGRTPDCIITSWNPAAERMYGYSSDEIVGTSAEFLIPEDRTNEMEPVVARIEAGQLVEHLETKRVRKDGTVFPVSLTISPIRDEKGAVVGTSVIARDMTKEREAFEAARSMIESSLDSLVAISPEGMITDANQATVKVTGVPRDKLIGTAFSDYFTDPEKANEIYQQVFAEGMAKDYPLTLRHHNGHETLTEVLYNASVYRDAGGEVLGVFAAARDVTDQMQAHRENTEQQAKAQERLAELEQFQRLTVGRELKMIELKKEIEYLRRLLPADGAEPSDLG